MGDSWNERMRMIRLRRKKEAFRFRDEFRIVPRWLKVLCVILYLLAVAIGVTVVIFHGCSPLRSATTWAWLAIVGIITAVGILWPAFDDARLRQPRRPSPRDEPGPCGRFWCWCFLRLRGHRFHHLLPDPRALLIHPRCTQLVGARFNFCPNCKGYRIGCPSCKRQ
jgi:hypothetical protein